VLTGEGSDELMAGYYRHWKTVYNLSLGARYYGWTPEALRRAARDGIDRLPIGSALRHRLSRTFLSRTPDVESLYLDNFAVFSREQQLRLLTPEAQGRAGALRFHMRRRAGRLAHKRRDDGRLNRLLYADTKTYLPRTAHEAGSDEHGGFRWKAAFRSLITGCRIHRAAA